MMRVYFFTDEDGQNRYFASKGEAREARASVELAVMQRGDPRANRDSIGDVDSLVFNSRAALVAYLNHHAS